MTNIKVLGLALFAMFAFSAVAASAAFAESEWLWKSRVIPAGEELPTDTETVETLTLDVLDPATKLILNEILCSGLFEGTVLPGGVDLITDAWTLPPSQQLIGELGGNSVTCEVTFDGGGTSCEVGSASVWVDELTLTSPALTWETLIELDGTTFLDHFHNVAFELLCKLLEPVGTELEALCSGLTSAVLENEGEAVLISFNEESEELQCVNSVGGTEVEKTPTAILGKFDILSVNAGSLAVS